VPTWRSYLYQDFLLPAFSPNNATEWLNLNSPFGHTQPIPDFVSPAWNDANDNHFAPTPTPPAPTASIKAEPQQWPQGPPQPVQQSGPSSFYTQPYCYNTSISTSLLASLLVGPQYGQGSDSLWYSAAQSQDGLPAVDKIDAELVRSPSPIDSLSTHVTTHLSPKLGQKRRESSLDSDVEHSHDEQEHEVPEGVERDGMIWGMKVEDYRALSARERKRVRNRISARTFRAKRKREHGRRALPACLGHVLPLSGVFLFNCHFCCYFPVSAPSTATDIWYSRAPLLSRVNPRRQGSPDEACPRRGCSVPQRGRRP
jgi:hypothetical protein